MTFQQVEDKVRDYLRINGRDDSEDAVKNYIYASAYKWLCREMYGTNPLERMGIKNEVKEEEPKSKPTGSMLKGGLNIKEK